MACLVASPRRKGNLRHGDVTRALGLSFSSGVDSSVVAVLLQRARRHDRAREERKTIGALFIDVFEAEAKKIGGAQFLAQGTLHPDVIETVSLTGGRPVTPGSTASDAVQARFEPG